VRRPANVNPWDYLTERLPGPFADLTNASGARTPSNLTAPASTPDACGSEPRRSSGRQ
jgi:hypothetical protein